MHRNNVLIHIQQDATLHSLFYLETALHFSGGTTTHHQERKQLYLQHLVFVRPLLLPAPIYIYIKIFLTMHGPINFKKVHVLFDSPPPYSILNQSDPVHSLTPHLILFPYYPTFRSDSQAYKFLC